MEKLFVSSILKKNKKKFSKLNDIEYISFKNKYLNIFKNINYNKLEIKLFLKIILFILIIIEVIVFTKYYFSLNFVNKNNLNNSLKNNNSNFYITNIIKYKNKILSTEEALKRGKKYLNICKRGLMTSYDIIFS